MAVALLDINVLMALAWPTHIHHDAAHRWFAANQGTSWATCPHTELGFLRLSIQPAVVRTSISFADAMRALTISLAAPEHEFWPLDFPLSEIQTEIRSRLIGHHQLADALLLDLAIRRSGKFATFDRRVRNLLPPDSGLQAVIELL
jgi:uncharacterized protein